MRWLNAATSNVINIPPPVYLHASAAEPKRTFAVNQVSMRNPYYATTTKIILRLMNGSSVSNILSKMIQVAMFWETKGKTFAIEERKLRIVNSAEQLVKLLAYHLLGMGIGE